MDTKQIREEFNGLIESISSIVISAEVKDTIEDLKKSINDSLGRIEKHYKIIETASSGFNQLRNEQVESERVLMQKLNDVDSLLTKLNESQNSNIITEALNQIRNEQEKNKKELTQKLNSLDPLLKKAYESQKANEENISSLLNMIYENSFIQNGQLKRLLYTILLVLLFIVVAVVGGITV